MDSDSDSENETVKSGILGEDIKEIEGHKIIIYFSYKEPTEILYEEQNLQNRLDSDGDLDVPRKKHKNASTNKISISHYTQTSIDDVGLQVKYY